MKKSIAVLSAFMIGINSFTSGAMVMAGQNESETIRTGYEPFEMEEKESSEFQEDEKAKEAETRELSEIENLQIPQKFEVVIDPWEMDGKGQIYSEQYVIQNKGEKAGILTLSCLICNHQGQDRVIVKTDKAGIHDNKEKSLYMEMVFGNGERIVLSEENSEYQVELRPGEELFICFTGEMNEYAEEGWKNGDVNVGIRYLWDIVETEMNENTEDMEVAMNMNSIENESDVSDMLENESGNNEKNIVSEGEESEGENQEFEEDDSKEETKVIDIQKFEISEFVIDSWEMNENGQFTSEQYVVRNTGDREGILGISKPICRSREESEILVKSEREELGEEKEKRIYAEIVLGNGEKQVLFQEETDYQVELKPEEEVSVCFIAEINQGVFESTEEEIVVSVSCSWNMLETADE